MSDEGPQLHARAPRAMSIAMVVIGVALVVSTLARGGGPIALGVILGVLFAAAGTGRLYVARKGL